MSIFLQQPFRTLIVRANLIFVFFLMLASLSRLGQAQENQAPTPLSTDTSARRAVTPKVQFRPVVVEGHPAPALVDASRGASLLVVGSRGHGEFAGMLLGSVSEHCVTKAHCPVLVLRDKA